MTEAHLTALLISHPDFLTVLRSFDVEKLQNHNTKVICRTILGSIDALREALHMVKEEPQPAKPARSFAPRPFQPPQPQLTINLQELFKDRGGLHANITPPT